MINQAALNKFRRYLIKAVKETERAKQQILSLILSSPPSSSTPSGFDPALSLRENCLLKYNADNPVRSVLFGASAEDCLRELMLNGGFIEEAADSSSSTPSGFDPALSLRENCLLKYKDDHSGRPVLFGASAENCLREIIRNGDFIAAYKYHIKQTAMHRMGLPPDFSENKTGPFWNDDSEFFYYFRGWQASGGGDSYGRFVFKAVRPDLDGFEGDCDSSSLYGLPVTPADKGRKPDFIAGGYPFLLAPPKIIKNESEKCD